VSQTQGDLSALSLSRHHLTAGAVVHNIAPMSEPARTVAFRAGLLAAGAAVFVSAMTTPATAEFSVCNQTLDVVNVAIGQKHGDIFRTEGWWTIGSNQCATVIREELQNQFIYVFATDVFGQTVLDGTERMCIGSGRFSIDGTESCWTRGYRETEFVEVDTKAVERWTMFLSDTPAPAN